MKKEIHGAWNAIHSKLILDEKLDEVPKTEVKATVGERNTSPGPVPLRSERARKFLWHLGICGQLR